MPAKKWTIETVLPVAQRHKTRKEFQDDDKGAYLAAYRGKFLDEVCLHMDRQVRERFTKESVLAIAKTFRTRREFQKGDGAAYNAALTNGWQEAFSHMELLRQKPDKDRILSIAKQYRTRTEFAKNNWSAYLQASRRGWLDEVCEGMEAAPSSGGFKPDDPAYLYQIEFSLPDGSKVWKVGITNKSVDDRVKGMRKQPGVGHAVTHEIFYGIGAEARAEERRLHGIGASLGVRYEGAPFLDNGNTEIFRSPLL